MLSISPKLCDGLFECRSTSELTITECLSWGDWSDWLIAQSGHCPRNDNALIQAITKTGSRRMPRLRIKAVRDIGSTTRAITDHYDYDTINLFRLKPIDIKFMRSLHDKVNIVPVIAKADTLTKSEIRSLKARVSLFVCCQINSKLLLYSLSSVIKKLYTCVPKLYDCY